MTREEYKKLLASDYWKGYSYSLIKERNFTCEDCGRMFYNERHKLQVHHLVYRDVNPWSYKPEEIVVLCEECHKKRHGITFTPPQTQHYTNQYPYIQYTRNELHNEWLNPNPNTTPNISPNTIHKTSNNTRNTAPLDTHRSIKFRYIVYLFLFLFAILLGVNNLLLKHQTQKDLIEEINQTNNNEVITTKPSNNISSQINNTNKTTKPKSKPIAKENTQTTQQKTENPHTKQEQTHSITSSLTEQSNPIISNEIKLDNNIRHIVETKPETTQELSTLELLERESYKNAVKQAEREGVSTEGSTLDILERISHANAVKQAKREGVSTEGSTLDILERISHANAVKQAEREGVSTEGSTLDILERISHANAVKQAEREGVSTEGSTLDILERISRKRLEKYNQ